MRIVWIKEKGKADINHASSEGLRFGSSFQGEEKYENSTHLRAGTTAAIVSFIFLRSSNYIDPRVIEASTLSSPYLFFRHIPKCHSKNKQFFIEFD